MRVLFKNELDESTIVEAMHLGREKDKILLTMMDGTVLFCQDADLVKDFDAFSTLLVKQDYVDFSYHVFKSYKCATLFDAIDKAIKGLEESQ